METAASSELPDERLKSVLETLDPQPILDAATLALLGWAAEYYHHPVGEVLAAALPKALRLGAAIDCRRRALDRHPCRPGSVHAAASPGALRASGSSWLRCAERGLTAAELDEKLGSWRDAARALIARGWLSTVALPPAAGAAPTPAPLAVSPGPEPNEEQRLAIDRVCESLGAFGGFVLHGVTGSGKTEVYLRVVERALAARPERAGPGAGNRPDAAAG